MSAQGEGAQAGMSGECQHRLSPEARELIAWDLAQESAHAEVDVMERRRRWRAFTHRFGGPAEPVAQVEALDAGGVPARLYRPAGGERAVLVWLHGGGWQIGDLDSHDPFARALANRTGCAVLNVDYRLAPEHPYPAAVDDAWAALRWACERFEQVAVGGDSAGGNLAAAVALRARDAGLALAHQLLVYPAVDPRLEGPFVEQFVVRYAQLGDWQDFGAESRDGVLRVWDEYLVDRARRDEPDAAPLRAASLAGVAPATLLLAEHDILLGECQAYAARLEREGVAVELIHYPEQLHGFFGMLALDDGRDAMEHVAAVLRRAFAADDRTEAAA
jgi:acetyl esterase